MDMNSRLRNWILAIAISAFALFGQYGDIPSSALRFYIDGMTAEMVGDFDRAMGSYLIADSYAPDHPDIMLTIAELYQQNGDADQAFAWFERLVKLDSENVAYRKGAAESARGARKPEVALEHLRWLVKNGKADYPTRFRYVTSLLSAGKERDAIKELNAIAKEFPESPDPHGFLGNIYIGRGDYNRAINSFERALELDPTYSRAFIGLSAAHEARGEIEIARQYQRVYIESNPFDLEAQRRFIWQLIDEGEFEEAFEIAADYVEHAEDDLFIFRQTAFLAYSFEHYEEAVDYFERYIEKNPLDQDARLYLGRAFFELGEHQRAIEQYRIILEDERSAEVLIDIALAYSAANMPDSAIAVIESAREEYPETAAVVFYEAVIYSRSKDYETAVLRYSTALELEPENPRAMFGLGDALERMGERDSAIAIFRVIAELLPGDALTANYLGYLLVEEGIELDFADSLISLAIKQEPENAAFIDSYGWLLYKRGEFERALEKLLLAEKLSDPNDPVILEHIGVVLEETGDLVGAKDYYKRALELDPEMETSIQRLKELKHE
ncbi:MAG TPA: tetratricopeptide repeat protein [candidate division Zixibacteria bacterium]|nr:tetratricopeptide repeat protein [candidate division Zixibacteria bacterium]